MTRREADFPGEPKTIGELMRLEGASPTTNDAPAQAPRGNGVRDACAQIADAKAREALDRGYRLAKSRTGKDKANAAARMAEEIAAAIRALASDASPHEELAALRKSYEALYALWRDASPRGEAVAELNAVESAMLEIAQSEGPRGFVLLSPDQARDLIINAQAFCEARGIKVAAHPAPATVESGDIQLLDRLKRDNTHHGARPIVSGGEEFAQAWRLSEDGMVALEQVAKGVRLHITRKGVKALAAALAPATEGRRG